MKFKADLRPFFETLADAVDPFMSHVRIKGHNCNGCRVLAGKGKKKGFVQFAFLAKGDNEITVEIDPHALAKNTKEYVDYMLHGINNAILDMKREGNLIILPNMDVMAPPKGLVEQQLIIPGRTMPPTIIGIPSFRGKH